MIDAVVEFVKRAIRAADFVEELGGDAFDADPIVRSELAELVRSPFHRKILRQSAFDHRRSTACNRQIARVRAATSC
ncbi:MAG: hypothetical protein QOJ71_3046 [Actinomycetota bacterium]|nr:hypothetical protein [Actinomycetota bacterium]